MCVLIESRLTNTRIISRYYATEGGFKFKKFLMGCDRLLVIGQIRFIKDNPRIESTKGYELDFNP